MADEEEIFEGRVIRLLPAWFVPRMTQDTWSFGLILSNDLVLAIEQIDNVVSGADGSIWLDVEMTSADRVRDMKRFLPASISDRLIGAPTSRTTASINTAHVIAAIELADT